MNAGRVAVRPLAAKRRNVVRCQQSTTSRSDPPLGETSKRRPRHGARDRTRAPSAVAFWRKRDKNSGAVRALSDEVSRFRGEGVGRRTVALRLSTTLAPPLPVRKTDLGVGGLGTSGGLEASLAQPATPVRGFKMPVRFSGQRGRAGSLGGSGCLVHARARVPDRAGLRI
jgi:hypothetical protein